MRIDEFVLEKRYLASGGGKCPFCGSVELEGGSYDFDGDVTLEVSCNDCHASWKDVYTLTAMIDIVQPKEEGDE